MDNQKIVEILLKFGVVPGEAKGVSAEMEAALMSPVKKAVVLKNALQDLMKEASRLRKELADTKSGTDAYQSIERQIKNVNKAIRDTRKDIRETTMELGDMKEQLGKVGSAGGIMAGLSAAFFTPLIAAANEYSNKIKYADGVSAQWINTSRQMEESQMRLGRVATNLLNPAYEKLSNTLSDMMGVIEKNPKVLEIAAMAVGGIGALGTAMVAATSLGKMVMQLQEMSAMGGAAGTIGKAGTAMGTVALYATAVVIGAELGALIGNAVAKAIYGETYQKQTIGDAILTQLKMWELPALATAKMIDALALKLTGKVTGIFDWVREKENAINSGVGGAVGASEYASGTPAGAAPGNKDFFAQQNVAMWESYKQAITTLEKDTATQRANIIQQYGQKMVDAESKYTSERASIISQHRQNQARALQDYETQRTSAIANFALQQANAEKAYYLQRKQAAAQHNLETQNMEKQHQEEMRRLSKEHNKRVKNLVGERDALGLVEEMRNYEDQRSEAERQYQIQLEQTNAQFALQIKMQDEQYALQRQQAIAEFQLQQKEAAEKYEIDKQRENQEFSQKLKELDEQHKAEMKQLENAKQQELQLLQQAYQRQLSNLEQSLITQINSMDQLILGEFTAVNDKMMTEYSEFLDFINSHQGSTGQSVQGSRASGGYVWKGLFQTHDNEYVMDERTTRTAERALGGRVTNASLQRALSAGGSSININISGGGLTVSEVRKLVASSRDDVLRSIAGALPA